MNGVPIRLSVWDKNRPLKSPYFCEISLDGLPFFGLFLGLIFIAVQVHGIRSRRTSL